MIILYYTILDNLNSIRLNNSINIKMLNPKARKYQRLKARSKDTKVLTLSTAFILISSCETRTSTILALPTRAATMRNVSPFCTVSGGMSSGLVAVEVTIVVVVVIWYW